MDWAKTITWPAAVVATVLLAAVCSLVIWGHVDLKDIGAFATTVIGALILAQQKAVRDQATRIESNTNGSLEQLRTENRELHKTIAIMAAQLPQDAPLPKALTDEQAAPVPSGTASG